MKMDCQYSRLAKNPWAAECSYDSREGSGVDERVGVQINNHKFPFRLVVAANPKGG